MKVSSLLQWIHRTLTWNPCVCVWLSISCQLFSVVVRFLPNNMFNRPVSVLWARVECFHLLWLEPALSTFTNLQSSMCLDISVSSGTTSNEVAYLRGEGRDDQSPGSRQSDTHTHRKWFMVLLTCFSKGVLMDSSVQVCCFSRLSVWLKDQPMQLDSRYRPRCRTVWLPELCWLSRRSFRTRQQHLDQDRSQERPNHSHRTSASTHATGLATRGKYMC